MKTLIPNILVPLSFAFMATASHEQTPHFRSDYSYVPAIDGWLKLHEIPKTWNEAKLACYYEGATLASPTSCELRQAMSELAANVTRAKIFTGIHNSYSRQVFNSIEGVLLSDIPHQWENGHPTASSDDPTGLILSFNGKLTVSDSKDAFQYACYKKYKNFTVTECGTVDKEYNLDRSTGKCYKFHSNKHSWSRAYQICVSEGGHLAVVNSATEAEVLAELFKHNIEGIEELKLLSVYLGFRDWEDHGEWVTIHGESLSEAGYDKFGKGEPNNGGGNQYCGGLSTMYPKLLDDISCNGPYMFICEKDPKRLVTKVII